MFDHIFVEIMVFCKRARTVIRSKYTDIDASLISIIALLVTVYRNRGVLTFLVSVEQHVKINFSAWRTTRVNAQFGVVSRSNTAFF